MATPGLAKRAEQEEWIHRAEELVPRIWCPHDRRYWFSSVSLLG